MGGAGAFMAARVLVYHVKWWGTQPHPNGRAAIKAPTFPIFHPRPYGQPELCCDFDEGARLPRRPSSIGPDRYRYKDDQDAHAPRDRLQDGRGIRLVEE